MRSSMRPLVVLPTYNERATAVAVLRGVRAALPEAEVLVVDDSSPDGTADVVKKEADLLGSVHLLVRGKKEGLGAAYRAGFEWGLGHGYDILVEMDSDLSHDALALPALVAGVQNGADLSIGSRYVVGGSVPTWRWWRRLLSRAGNAYADRMLGLHVEDSTSGLRAYRASLVEELGVGTAAADGYAFQVEMTYRARCAGARVVEVPIRFAERAAGRSKMSAKVVVEAMWLVTVWGAGRAARRLAGRVSTAGAGRPGAPGRG
ncbi:MAG: polyprenol monophosphomannose synthase [Acidimicrobiales bacterium]